MKKLIPVILALFGLGAGLGAGLILRPAVEDLATQDMPPGNENSEMRDVSNRDLSKESGEPDYVKLSNQFVVPVLNDGSVTALVVMTLSVELTSGGPELVYKREPKLRDVFLQVLFDHANNGGFDGNFTTGQNMEQLRTALRETAQKILGEAVTDILIVDVLRQDV